MMHRNILQRLITSATIAALILAVPGPGPLNVFAQAVTQVPANVAPITSGSIGTVGTAITSAAQQFQTRPLSLSKLGPMLPGKISIQPTTHSPTPFSSTPHQKMKGPFIKNSLPERLDRMVSAIETARSKEDVDKQLNDLYEATTVNQESVFAATDDLGQHSGASRSGEAGKIRPFEESKSLTTPKTLAIRSGLPTPTTPPAVLYHWVSFKVLKHWANDIKKTGHFILRKIYDGTLLAIHYPNLAGTSGLFTWIHPLLGMGLDAKEIYGNGEALVRLDINPKATVKIIETQNGVKPPPIDLRGIDLLYHRRIYPLADGSFGVDWQEWVVVNPAAVLRFTANPKTISSDIDARIRKSERHFDPESRMYDFPADQLHVSSFLFSMENMFKKIVIARARNFIHLNADLIPKIFLGQTRPNAETKNKHARPRQPARK